MCVWVFCLVLFVCFFRVTFFVAVSQEPAPYLVVKGEDGIELLRGQLHPLGSGKGHQGVRGGNGATSREQELLFLILLLFF